MVKTLVLESGVQLTVHDNGNGIDREQVKHLFAQGFTTKETGLGLGLHYSANTVQEMGGEIHFQSEGLGKGAEVTLFFPIGPRV